MSLLFGTFSGETRRRVGGRPSQQHGILRLKFSYAVMFHRRSACSGYPALFPHPTLGGCGSTHLECGGFCYSRFCRFASCSFSRGRLRLRLLEQRRSRRLSRAPRKRFSFRVVRDAGGRSPCWGDTQPTLELFLMLPGSVSGSFPITDGPTRIPKKE